MATETVDHEFLDQPLSGHPMDAPLQVQDVNGTYYVHADHLQTPRLATGSAAQIVWRSRYEAFWQAITEEDVDGDSVVVRLNFRFPGQYFDAESGLHYNYFRDYDPATGRYVQSDPIGIDGGINVCVYVEDNPINYFDRMGLVCGSGPSEYFVSDSPFGTDISDCCKAHDDCYGDCFLSPPKSYCDDQFKNCILRKCAALTGAKRRLCLPSAAGYPWGVGTRFGDSAFRDARRNDPKPAMYGGTTIGGAMSRLPRR